MGIHSSEDLLYTVQYIQIAKVTYIHYVQFFSLV